MLRSIRNNSKGTIAKIIIAAILIIFALGGLSTCENKSVSPLTVNGQTIDQNELLLEMQIVRNQLLSSMGDNIDYDQLTQEKILPIVINRLTEQLLVQQSLDKMSMTIPDSMIENIIFNNPSFQQDGTFSNQLLTNFINNQGITLPLLKKRIANDLNQSQLTSGISLSYFSLPFSEQIILDIFNERRKISWSKLSLDNFFNSASVSSDELKEFYDNNKMDFKSELQVVVEYIEFKLEDLYRPVSEEEIIADYNIQSMQFISEESREISHILLETNDSQNEEQVFEKFDIIRERLTEGETFSDLALEFSQDLGSSDSGGYLGFIEKDSGFPDSFEKTVFSMEVGDISQPVKSEAGFHIINLISLDKSSLEPIDNLRDEIEEQIKIRKAKSEYISLLEEAADISFNAIDLAGPADILEMQVSTSEPITRLGLSSESLGDTNDIFKNEKVASVIFSDEILIEGLNSELLELGQDRSILLRAKEIIQPRQLSLNEVKNEISFKLKTKLAKNKISEISQAIIGDVLSGVLFDEAITVSDNKIEELTLSRGSVDIDQQFLNDIFEKNRLHSSNKVNEFKSSNGDIYLYQLLEIFKDDEVEPDAIAALGQQLKNLGGQQDISNFMNSVRLNSDIEVQ